MLVIRWSFAETDYLDFHVYVKGVTYKGVTFDYRYLGQTKSGTAHSLVWAQGASGIDADFISGPAFGDSYQFRVYGLTISGTPPFRGPLETAGLVPFNNQESPLSPTPTATPTLTPTATPTLTPIELAPGAVIVTDDEFTAEDLSNGEDHDTAAGRMLVIRWNFAETDYREFHVYVKRLADDYKYLGRADSGEAHSLVWSQGASGIHADSVSGPVFGESYQFRVYGLTISGSPFFRGPLETAGPVRFSEETPPIPTSTPTATPTPTELPAGVVIVTDDIHTYEDLSNGEDLDSAAERMLVIRWNFAETDYKDFHVYVRGLTGEYKYLGHTKSGTVHSLVWAQGASGIHKDFTFGPVFGESYQFRVYGLTVSGSPLFRGPLVSAGPVQFKEEHLP